METNSVGVEITPKPVAQVKLIGVGNAGVNVLEQLVSAGLEGVGFAAVNTDGNSLAGSAAVEKVHLETKMLRGLGTAGDPERGRTMAEEQLPRLQGLCDGAR